MLGFSDLAGFPELCAFVVHSLSFLGSCRQYVFTVFLYVSSPAPKSETANLHQIDCVAEVVQMTCSTG